MTASKVGAFIVALGIAGCAGPGANQPPPRTAPAVTAAPATSPPAAAPAAAPAPAKKKVTGEDRAELNRALAKWQAAKKAGPLSEGDCRSLAGRFVDAAHVKSLAAEAHFNAGTILESCGQRRAAEAEYQAALQANAGFGPAMNNLGELAYKQGDRAQARVWFDKAIAADPTHNSHPYNNLALLLFEQARAGEPGAYKEAVSKLRRALAIDGESMAAYSLLALIYYSTAESDRSKLQLAELVCKQAKEVNDHYAPIYNTLGLIQLRRKNVTGALKEFERAVELDPHYAEAHLNIGAIGLSSRSYAKAQAAFQAVLKLQPTNVDAIIGMGVAARGQKHFDDAERWYKKAAELDPKNCAIPYNLGLLYQDYKSSDAAELKQAQEYYQKFLSCGRAERPKLAEAQRRIKDIDETFAALEQQKRMEADVKQQQEEMERQQKQQEKKTGGGASLAPATPAPEAAQARRKPAPNALKSR